MNSKKYLDKWGVSKKLSKVSKKMGIGVQLLGVLICICSIVLGLYMGLWICLVGGIMGIVDGFAADPFNSLMIGVGVLKFISSGIVGWLSFICGCGAGLGLITVGQQQERGY